MKIEVNNKCSDFNSYRAARVKSLFNCDSGANFSISANLPELNGGGRWGLLLGRLEAEKPVLEG